MVTEIINFLNENIFWGIPALTLFIGTGLFFTVKLRFSQFNLVKIFKNTFFSKSKNSTDKNEKTLTPFQTLTSTLAVTLGTGNIVALGAAIALGGAGAVFWMWVSAFLGMATAYAENYLGMKHRRRREDGGYFGGAFFYIEKILGKGWGKFFALCCILTGLGMGNMTQINAFSSSMKNSFETPVWLSGIIAAVLVGFFVFGGAVFLGEVTEKVIPVMSGLYILGCLAVIFSRIELIPAVFMNIIKEAFNLNAVGGGILGAVMLRGMSWGFRRGIFSNEAGLGSSVILNSMSSETSAERQGTWAMLTVFFDTIVMCTLTAFAILLTGADKIGGTGTNFAAVAFGAVFGEYADAFVTVCIALFAVSTAAGWSVFGSVSVEYLLGKKYVKPFLFIFTACCFIGAVMDLEIVWGLADIFNGMMAVPNLLSLLMLGYKQKMQD